MSPEPTHKQKYVLDEVSLALSRLNAYLRKQRASFALSDEELSRVRFSFDRANDGENVFVLPPESIDDVLNDVYSHGRIAGIVFHKIRNSSFGTPGTDLPKMLVERVVQHCFALLYIQSRDRNANLRDAPKIYHSASDFRIGYSFLEEIVDPLQEVDLSGYEVEDSEGAQDTPKKDPKQGKKDGQSIIETNIMREAQERKEYLKERERDKEFKAVEFPESEDGDEDFSVPELEGYHDHEVHTHDAFSIDLDKMKNEGFNVALAIVEGRGPDEKNWRRCLEELLPMDVDVAKKYLAKILDY